MTDTDCSLPSYRRMVTAQDIIAGAAATRDWQPQHHDAAHARAMKLPDIIMNAPTQTGWFHAYAARWAGAGYRIARWRLKMLRSICPGSEVILSGVVRRTELADGVGLWTWLELKMTVDGEASSNMALLLCRPIRSETSCLDLAETLWSPPPLDD